MTRSKQGINDVFFDLTEISKSVNKHLFENLRIESAPVFATVATFMCETQMVTVNNICDKMLKFAAYLKGRGNRVSGVKHSAKIWYLAEYDVLMEDIQVFLSSFMLIETVYNIGKAMRDNVEALKNMEKTYYLAVRGAFQTIQSIVDKWIACLVWRGAGI